jgi:hypothetical protein
MKSPLCHYSHVYHIFDVPGLNLMVSPWRDASAREMLALGSYYQIGYVDLLM